jgi:hypothetical protein
MEGGAPANQTGSAAGATNSSLPFQHVRISCVRHPSTFANGLQVLESVLLALAKGGPGAVQAALSGVPSSLAALASAGGGGRSSGGALSVPQGPVSGGGGGGPGGMSGGSCGAAGRPSGGGRSPPRLTQHLGSRQLEALRLVALSRKLWEVMYPDLAADGLLVPLMKVEMPLVGGGVGTTHGSAGGAACGPVKCQLIMMCMPKAC